MDRIGGATSVLREAFGWPMATWGRAMTDNPQSGHVRFERPPVIETVFGVQFQPLQKWQIPTFGLFWATIRDRYPQYTVAPPLETQIEDISQPPRQMGGVAFNIFPGPPPPRCWFFNQSESQLIQVQPDRFIFNWKRGLVEAPYPHYESIRPILQKEWEHYCSFVASNALGKIDVRQCEVSYINHIEKGVEWKDFSELDSILTVWSGGVLNRTSLKPEDINIGIRYRLPERMGRLHVLCEPAIRTTDYKEVLQLTLTARGVPESPDSKNVFEWFDIAQGLVREAFVDLTTEKMHEIWGIRN
jgi:uncharacterized protein (TIGR04255 family)